VKLEKGRHSILRSCWRFKKNMEAAPRFELGLKVLQTSALPLGYAALILKRTGFLMERKPERLERETGFEPATATLAR
jgi:hypothetical protein